MPDGEGGAEDTALWIHVKATDETAPALGSAKAGVEGLAAAQGAAAGQARVYDTSATTTIRTMRMGLGAATHLTMSLGMLAGITGSNSKEMKMLHTILTLVSVGMAIANVAARISAAMSYANVAAKTAETAAVNTTATAYRGLQAAMGPAGWVSLGVGAAVQGGAFAAMPSGQTVPGEMRTVGRTGVALVHAGEEIGRPMGGGEGGVSIGEMHIHGVADAYEAQLAMGREIERLRWRGRI